MNIVFKFIIFGVILIIIYECVIAYTRYLKRKRIYDIAKKASLDLKKPLLVIGDPDNGSANHVFGRCYECGDLCLDITGCPKCERSIQSSVEDFLPKLESNSHVIFISCVLEYVDSEKLNFVISEIKRVSGNDFYLISVEPFSLTAMFYPTRFITNEGSPKNIILSEYPDKTIHYQKL